MKLTLVSAFLFSIATVTMAADRSYTKVKCEDSNQYSICLAAIKKSPTPLNLLLAVEDPKTKQANLIADGNGDDSNCAEIALQFLTVEGCSKCSPVLQSAKLVCQPVPDFLQ